jgi:hypothetical protein
MDLNSDGMKRANYFLWMMVPILAACIPDPLPVGNVPQLKPKIVVSSQMTSNESVAIFLTKSIGALDASDDSDLTELLAQIVINDAVVTIYNDSFSQTLSFVGDGLYTSTSMSFVEGEEYHLLVESETMGIVTSTTRVKGQVLFESLEGNIYDNGYDTLAEIQYSFNDPVGENFYMLNVQRVKSDYEPEDFLNPRIFTRLLTDRSFDGQFYFDDMRVLSGRRDFFPGDTLGVFLSNVSEDYFGFMELRLDSRYNFADFLGEPANYPTNVNGGLGYFNLHIPDVRILVLEE